MEEYKENIKDLVEQAEAHAEKLASTIRDLKEIVLDWE